MVLEIFKNINENLRRRIRRAFLAEPDKMPQRFAIVMASVLLVSIVVTYNILFEREKQKEGINPPTVIDLFQERSAKKRREHLELQRNIAQARDKTKTTTTGNDL